MREEIANLVHPVLARGLDLRDRLLSGEDPPFEVEQSALISQLKSEREARQWPEFGGDDPDARHPVRASGPADTGEQERFLGARYALACWLDEMFILDTPWSQHWNEYKLEMRLYGSNDRAWRFWDQARLAASQAGGDALEVYFLCVMLGFTGQYAEQPDQLAAWITTTRTQLTHIREAQWRPPPGLEVLTRVPPLRGRWALKRMLLVTSATLLALVPVLAIFLARGFS
jgi:type VI secretion system protein ImpK